MVRGRIRATGADLFSSASLRETPSPGAKPSQKAPSETEFPAAASSPRYLLPKDLSRIKQLTDQEFDRLLAAVFAEQKRRGKKLPVSRKASGKPPVQEFGPPPAKVNAVRAAFKAGVAPSRIARQFGISQVDVRTALASDPSKRSPNEV
jgi:hypothetical protein